MPEALTFRSKLNFCLQLVFWVTGLDIFGDKIKEERGEGGCCWIKANKSFVLNSSRNHYATVYLLDFWEKATATLVKLPPKLLCIPKGIKALPLCWVMFSLVVCKCKFIDQPGHSKTFDYQPSHIKNRFHLLQATCCPSSKWHKPSFCMWPYSMTQSCIHVSVVPTQTPDKFKGLLRSPEDHTTETDPQR